MQDSFDMIRDLLDLAAAQRIGDAAPPAPVRLEDALRHVIETAREHARSKGLEFVEDIKAGDCILAAEPADLERIFSNLLSNAVKYTCCGHVAIGARRLNDCLDAWVEDTGMGIAPDDADKVYAGFFRSAAARASGEMGTGLGLSIVRHVIERLGGTISLTSEPGKGTRFSVQLPLVDG
jgi:signal transduction histidine kinase